MKLTDLNPNGGIGSNAHLLEIGPFRLLVDCGLNPKEIGNAAMPTLDLLDAEELDLIVLTHCHLDHLGALPVAWRKFPRTPIITSRPSQILAPRMLRNSCTVMRRQRDELHISEYPLYTYDEVDALDHHLESVDFERPYYVDKKGETLSVTLHPAGHVAGAAGLTIEYRHQRIFITGDVLFQKQRILDGAHFPQDHCDILIMETTRGMSPREDSYSREAETEQLLTTINQTIDHGGSVLIPIFALGRMQEVLTILNEAKTARKLAQAPIYCSGLGIDLVDYFDTITRKTGLLRFRKSVLQSLKAKPLRQNLVPGKEPSEPAIYVVSSGMMVEHTPSYHLAASLLHLAHNTVCFVGYCDPDTPGGQLLRTSHGERFFFETLDYECLVRAKIEQFDFSGHADRDELVDFALLKDPRAIILTHGDPPARSWFEERLQEVAPHIQVYNPTPGVSYQV